MAPPRHTAAYEDLSDSDEEDRLAGVETDVLLGIPDGSVGIENDIFDAAVSRIGGLPVRASPSRVIHCAEYIDHPPWFAFAKKGTTSTQRTSVSIFFLQILFPTNGTPHSNMVSF